MQELVQGMLYAVPSSKWTRCVLAGAAASWSICVYLTAGGSKAVLSLQSHQIETRSFVLEPDIGWPAQVWLRAETTEILCVIV